MSIGNFRDNRIAREEQMAQLRANANQGLLEDFAEIGALIGPSPQQIRRGAEKRGLISPNPFLTTGEPTDFNQVNALDSALLSQGMPPISSPSPFVTDAARDTTAAEDIGLVSPEEFIQDATQFGEPETAFPVVERTQEEKDETKSRFSDLGDIFDNKQALGKIALGIALIEGTPMTEAFELYENFVDTNVDNSLEVEVYDTQTRQVVGQGSDENMQLRQLVQSDPSRYRLQPFGTQADIDSATEESRIARFTENNNEILKEAFIPALAEAETGLADFERLYDIVQRDDFESGKTEAATLQLRRYLSDVFGVKDDSLDDQVLFETIISRLIPNVRPKGAGATSDFEINLYERAVPSLGNTKEQNMKIIEEYLKAGRIKQARANYVIDRTSEVADVTATAHATDFSNIINKIEKARESGAAVDLSDEEKKIVGSIYNIITLEEALNYPANKTLPTDTIILQ